MWILTERCSLINLAQAYYIGTKYDNDSKSWWVYACFNVYNPAMEDETFINIRQFEREGQALIFIEGLLNKELAQ